jgi:tRNA-dihydrouridine synthase
MAEISHRGLRELIAEYLRDPVFAVKNGHEGFVPPQIEYFTEMLSAGALLGGGPFERWYLDAGPCPGQLVYQLVGADAGQLERAAALLDGLDCLGIDINMGCAAPAIRRTGAGAAWTGKPEEARAMIGRVRSSVKRKRLSVKLRCPLMGPGLEPPKGPSGGSGSPAEGRMFEYLVRFCRMLEDEGVQLITFHPRLAEEKFKRPARWGYVERLRRELRIPVAGNGDIGSAAELAARSGEGRVMAGRAAVRQPWIFAAARLLTARLLAAGGTAAAGETAAGAGIPPAGAVNRPPARPPGCSSDPFGGLSVDLEKTGLRFLELLARYQPPEFHISRARRFFRCFCDNLKWGTYVKNLLNREQSLSGIEGAWRGYFASRPEDALSAVDGGAA